MGERERDVRGEGVGGPGRLRVEAKTASTCKKKEEDRPRRGDRRSRQRSETKQKKQSGRFKLRGTTGIGSQIASGDGTEVKEKPVAAFSCSEHVQGRHCQLDRAEQ